MLKWLWLSALVVVVDQATKWMASAWLEPNVPYPLLSWFNFNLTHNTGAAFSFLSGASGWQRWFFTVLSIVVSALIFIWLKRLKPGERWTAAGLALILGGAIGNLIDRIAYGQVIDFIQWYYDRYYWPTFNIADSAITVGAAILIIHGILFREEKPNT
ncbi:MAG: signal peptidase II [Pseudomonadota bacterium]|nr:signal peptidase II [Pseudomonadota bacterium]